MQLFYAEDVASKKLALTTLLQSRWNNTSICRKSFWILWSSVITQTRGWILWPIILTSLSDNGIYEVIDQVTGSIEIKLCVEQATIT